MARRNSRTPSMEEDFYEHFRRDLMPMVWHDEGVRSGGRIDVPYRRRTYRQKIEDLIRSGDFGESTRNWRDPVWLDTLTEEDVGPNRSRSPRIEIHSAREMEGLVGPIQDLGKGEENLYFRDDNDQGYFFKHDGREREAKRIEEYFEERVGDHPRPRKNPHSPQQFKRQEFAANRPKGDRWRTFRGARPNPIQDPNSSGQGTDLDHLDNPFHRTLVKHGLTYSHSTPVHVRGHGSTPHHTYRLNRKFAVGVHESPTHGGGWTWEGSVSGSGRHYTGFDRSHLDDYLKGAVKRHGGARKNPKPVRGTLKARSPKRSRKPSTRVREFVDFYERADENGRRFMTARLATEEAAFKRAVKKALKDAGLAARGNPGERVYPNRQRHEVWSSGNWTIWMVAPDARGSTRRIPYEQRMLDAKRFTKMNKRRLFEIEGDLQKDKVWVWPSIVYEGRRGEPRRRAEVLYNEIDKGRVPKNVQAAMQRIADDIHEAHPSYIYLSDYRARKRKKPARKNSSRTPRKNEHVVWSKGNWTIRHLQGDRYVVNGDGQNTFIDYPVIYHDGTVGWDYVPPKYVGEAFLGLLEKKRRA
jgi:hypothetical protein